MDDRRSEPGQPKKRPERAAGAPSRRGSGTPGRNEEPPRRSTDGRPRRSDGSGGFAGRGATPQAGGAGSGGRRADRSEASGRFGDRPERPSAGDPRPARGTGARSDRGVRNQPGERSGDPGRPIRPSGRRDGADAEPGFGPFRGRQRDGGPVAGQERPRRAVDDAGSGGRPNRPGRRGQSRGAVEEARTVRSAAEEAVARASGEPRPALRIVHGLDGTEAKRQGRPRKPGKGGVRKGAAGGAPAAQRPKPARDGARLQEALVRGARALERGYEQEALRILRPYRDPHPDSAELRELLGVAYYRLGRWSLAQKELEAFVALTGSTEQHPVLMDCARALGRFDRVESLWQELRTASPGAEIVTEGRIVAAGALADQGRLDDAIKVLERAPAGAKRVLPHHLRLWYALADLHERAGDIPAARALFRKVSAQDPRFVDVAERLAALS